MEKFMTQILATPQITTAQRLALVSPPDGTIVFDTDLGQFQTTSDGGATWQTTASTSDLTSSIANLIYISSLGSDTTGTGSILNPYATYAKAVAVALAAPATALVPYIIKPIGVINITGDMT